MSVDSEMGTENVVYIYDGILFGLKKEILASLMTQMALEDIMLSEIRQP